MVRRRSTRKEYRVEPVAMGKNTFLFHPRDSRPRPNVFSYLPSSPTSACDTLDRPGGVRALVVFDDRREKMIGSSKLDPDSDPETSTNVTVLKRVR